MKNILGKLEQAAANFIAHIDNDLQEPLVHAMKGEVFTHGMEQQLPRKAKEVAQNSLAQSIDEGNQAESKAVEMPKAEKRR
jgi:hypothetical protein